MTFHHVLIRVSNITDTHYKTLSGLSSVSLNVEFLVSMVSTVSVSRLLSILSQAMASLTLTSPRSSPVTGRMEPIPGHSAIEDGGRLSHHGIPVCHCFSFGPLGLPGSLEKQSPSRQIRLLP